MKNRVLALLILAPLLMLTVAASWQYAGMVYAPGTNTPQFGPDLVINGDFDAGNASWTRNNVECGTGRAVFTNDGATLQQNVGAATGSIYRVGYTTVSSNQTALYLSGSGFSSSTIVSKAPGVNTYNLLAVDTDPLFFVAFGAGTTVLDFITVNKWSVFSLLAPIRPFQGSGRFSATGTTANCATGEWLGVAAYLDSTISPTKGLFAYINRSTGNAELRVLTAANTWTSLINTAVTFVSGQTIRVDYNHSTKIAQLFYNNIQVGANQDVSAYAAWIGVNRRHAIFSTTAVTPGSVSYSFGPL